VLERAWALAPESPVVADVAERVTWAATQQVVARAS
jgi:hypothetical protein